MTKYYNKLVRDRIPQIIEDSGKKCVTQILTEDNYLKKLDEKLSEELAEYQASKSLEELADLLEVMKAVAVARGVSWDDVESLQIEKHKMRGGFTKRILLQAVEE